MGYSRENKRQNEALQSILDGVAPEKRIMVAMEDLNDKKEWQIYIGTDRVIDFAVSNDGSTDIVNVSAYTVADSDWHHMYIFKVIVEL